MTDQPAIDPNLLVSDFDYPLPPDLIAQEPAADRDGARLLVVDRDRQALTDSTIRTLPELLRAGDLVVLNNTRVIPARLKGTRSSGGAVEVLLLNRVEGEEGRWRALARPTKRLHPGSEMTFTSVAGNATATALVTDRFSEGEIEIQLPSEVDQNLEAYGEIPLPPYIRSFQGDLSRYQTVFSEVPGSVAAPTAGLHLSDEILERMTAAGVDTAFVTLRIGLDTFRPVTVDRVAEHRIHSEWCELPPETAAAIAACRERGGRVVAIGTTSARTLETWGNLPSDEQANGFRGNTSIFITPGYQWTTVDALLTNFHLPRSTLLMMISSLIGTDLTRMAYLHAVQQRYRFFSFGDAMFIV